MDNCSEKELIVRKRTGMFLEKLFHYFCDDFSHQRYKKIIYGEIPFESIPEEKFKSFYDGYIYLLNNAKNALTNNIISKFFYIMYGKEVASDLVIRLSTGYFDCVSKTPLETACKFLLLCNTEIVEITNIERTIISLMFFNYVLVKHDIPAIVLYVKDIENYLELIDRENVEEITLFMLSVIKDNVYQNKDYYENLKPLTFGDIFDTFIADKELLESFGVEHLYLFGSFINNEQRLDSDVDLMIRFKTNLNLKEKTKSIEQLKNLYFNKFQRFVDFVEIGTYVSDEIIKKTNNFERIF